MNITEANAVNVLLRALLDPNAPIPANDPQASVKGAALELADRAHRVLHAGYRPEDVVTSWPAAASLPVLDSVVDQHGNATVSLGENIEAAFLCYRTGTVGFLLQAKAESPPTLARLVEMLSDAAVAVVRSAGIEPPTGEV